MVAPTVDERAIKTWGGHCPPEKENNHIVTISIKNGRPMVTPTVEERAIKM